MTKQLTIDEFRRMSDETGSYAEIDWIDPQLIVGIDTHSLRKRNKAWYESTSIDSEPDDEDDYDDTDDEVISGYINKHMYRHLKACHGTQRPRRVMLVDARRYVAAVAYLITEFYSVRASLWLCSWSKIITSENASECLDDLMKAWDGADDFSKKLLASFVTGLFEYEGVDYKYCAELGTERTAFLHELWLRQNTESQAYLDRFRQDHSK